MQKTMEKEEAGKRLRSGNLAWMQLYEQVGLHASLLTPAFNMLVGTKMAGISVAGREVG